MHRARASIRDHALDRSPTASHACRDDPPAPDRGRDSPRSPSHRPSSSPFPSGRRERPVRAAARLARRGSPRGRRHQPTPIPIPIPGHEVYGFVPYWEMDDGNRRPRGRDGSHDARPVLGHPHEERGTSPTETGLRRIDGADRPPPDRRAHERGVRVELVYTRSAGEERPLLRRPRGPGADDRRAREARERARRSTESTSTSSSCPGARRSRMASSSAAQVRPAGGRPRPRSRWRRRRTSAGRRWPRAAAAGADRIFMMGYDYHWAGSRAGRSAPLDRPRRQRKDLAWSLDLYRDAGVPAERTILGPAALRHDAGRCWARSSAPPQDGPRATSGSRATNLATLARPELDRPGLRSARGRRAPRRSPTATAGRRSTSIRRRA